MMTTMTGRGPVRRKRIEVPPIAQVLLASEQPPYLRVIWLATGEVTVIPEERWDAFTELAGPRQGRTREEQAREAFRRLAVRGKAAGKLEVEGVKETVESLLGRVHIRPNVRK